LRSWRPRGRWAGLATAARRPGDGLSAELLHLGGQLVARSVGGVQPVREALDENEQPGQQAADGDGPHDGQEIAAAVSPQFLA
jgi:hypothetical protein